MKQPRERKKKERRIAVIDFETDPFKYGREPKPFCCGHFDGETYTLFWGEDCHIQLAEFLQDREEIIYAHNGGKFDFYYLLDFLESKRIKIINGRIAECWLGKAKLRDSYLILPLGLKHHDKGEIDYNIMEPENRNKKKNRKLIEIYLERDCRSLWSWVTKFIDRFGPGLTLAGRAFDQLAQTGYDIPIGNPTNDAFFRPYYFGGRVQCFEIGKVAGPLTYIDINSAYSYAMIHLHPWQICNVVHQKTLPDSPFTEPYFAHIKAISRGALPLRDEEGKIQYHDDGEIREYKVTGWELQAGLDTQTLKITEIIDIIVYPSVRDFKDYVEKFFAEKALCKEAGDVDGETFAKLMLNAAYGRFGINPEDYCDYIIQQKGEDPGPDWELALDLTDNHGIMIWQKPSPTKQYINVATAASITGFVRAYLWRAICASKRPIYCDTDSLIAEAYEGEVGKDLGQWKVEADVITAWIGGRKMYSVNIKPQKKKDGTIIEWKTASKGFRPPSPEILAQHIETGTVLEWQNQAPAFSLKGATKTKIWIENEDGTEIETEIDFGAKFVSRKITPETHKLFAENV